MATVNSATQTTTRTVYTLELSQSEAEFVAGVLGESACHHADLVSDGKPVYSLLNDELRANDKKLGTNSQARVGVYAHANNRFIRHGDADIERLVAELEALS
jgi:hypothetical protein